MLTYIIIHFLRCWVTGLSGIIIKKRRLRGLGNYSPIYGDLTNQDFGPRCMKTMMRLTISGCKRLISQPRGCYGLEKSIIFGKWVIQDPVVPVQKSIIM